MVLVSQDLRRFFALLLPHRWRYALGAVALVFSDGGQLVIAFLIGEAFDALDTGSTTAAGLGLYALGVAACALVIAVARFIWRNLIFGSARMIERDLRQRLFDHLQRQSPRFYLDHKVGELMAYATNDVAAVQMAAAGGMLAGLDALIQAGGAAIFMTAAVDWRLGVVSLTPLLFLPVGTYWLGRRIHLAYGKVQESFANLSDCAQESVAGIRVIKGFGREAAQARTFGDANFAYRDLVRRMLRYDSAFDPMISTLAGLSFTIGLAYGGLMVVRGELTLGRYIAFNTYLGMLVWPMLALGWITNLLQRAAASMARLDALFDTVPEVVDRPAARSLVDPRGHVRVRGLSFRYAEDLPPALIDLDVDVPPGHTLGILGRTGSGKSTVGHVLVRLFDPPPGTVFLDGVDVLELRLRDLRGAIAFVPQDAFLFSRTVEENIAFGPAARDRDAVVRAVRLADVEGDITALPGAYDTLVGERGVTLSGGQRQRVALARALVCDAPVLILDDCLSAVDTATEARILTALRPFTAHRTTLVISHRVSALRHADEIIVLADGRVAERGDHTTLLALGGEYAHLYARQQLEAALEVAE